jgi:hypothetical protein
MRDDGVKVVKCVFEVPGQPFYKYGGIWELGGARGAVNS